MSLFFAPIKRRKNLQKKRNYINAIVEFHEDGSQTEVIFKVGDFDLDDDMHVFAYLKSEKQMEELVKNGTEEFKILDYWKGIKPKNRILKPCDENELVIFFEEVRKSEKPKPE